MTDAAVPVTQSLTERFTITYLESLGGRVERDDRTWRVTIPNDAETDLPTGEFSLHCGDNDDTDDDGKRLHPESGFFRELLDEASSHTPVGTTTIDAAMVDPIIPDWLRNGEVEVLEADFTPYYDRTALTVFFGVTVETVSEYQQEFLRVISIDTRSEELLPTLDDTFLDLTRPEHSIPTSQGIDLGEDRVANLVDSVRDPLVDRIQPIIDEIHEEASRAADAEVEEYRQMQRQRQEELADDLDELRSRREDLKKKIDETDQDERVEALKARKELKAESAEIESELADLRERRGRGYPERQREIRDRHSLEVVITPLTTTQVEFESGETRFELTTGRQNHTLTVGYGSGVGVTEDVECSFCNRTFSKRYPVRAIAAGPTCEDCSEE